MDETIAMLVPEISLQEHDVLGLDPLNLVTVNQGVEVSIECKD
jgi:hypothetical protein